MGPYSSNGEVLQQFGFIDEVSVVVCVTVTGSAVYDDWIHVAGLNVEDVLGIVDSVV